MRHFLDFVPLGFAPGAFWLWWFRQRDRYEPEPLKLILRTALFGMAAGIVALVVESRVQGPRFLLAVAFAPAVEELCKLAAVWGTIYRHPEFDEPMDGLVYAAAAALGFASLENAGYLAMTAMKGAGGAVAAVFWARAILAVPGHVLFSSLWGSALGRAKFSPAERRAGMVAPAVALAIVAHGLWNSICFVPGAASLILQVFTVVLWVLFASNVRQLLGRSPFREREADLAAGAGSEEEHAGPVGGESGGEAARPADEARSAEPDEVPRG